MLRERNLTIACKLLPEGVGDSVACLCARCVLLNLETIQWRQNSRASHLAHLLLLRLPRRHSNFKKSVALGRSIARSLLFLPPLFLPLPPGYPLNLHWPLNETRADETLAKSPDAAYAARPPTAHVPSANHISIGHHRAPA